MQDPFEQFERSRAGFLIPMALLLVGMIPTAFSIGAMSRLEADTGRLEADRPVINAATTDIPVDKADSDSAASHSSANPQDERLP